MSGQVNAAALVLTILASGVIVLGGVTALVRAIVKLRDTIRDNSAATRTLTGRMDTFGQIVDGRLSKLEKMMLRVWAHLFPGEDPP